MNASLQGARLLSGEAVEQLEHRHPAAWRPGMGGGVRLYFGAILRATGGRALQMRSLG
jgi:hypothetical protein